MFGQPSQPDECESVKKDIGTNGTMEWNLDPVCKRDPGQLQ